MLWPALALSVLSVGPAAPAARAALEKSCGRCHRGGESDEGGFDFLLERDALVREGFIVPGDVAGSRLVQRVKKREMPPPEAKQRAGAELLPALEAWIRQGAPAEGFEVPKPPAAVALSGEVLIRAVLEDANGLGARTTARWFTVRPGDETALAKALNSLSWKSKLVHPVPVRPGLVRIDLDELGWSTADWERTLLDAYPFALETGSLDEQTLRSATSSAQPVLRADWFVATATRPPLYHALARTPANEAALEALLDVRVKEDIARGAVVRIGFASSGVSQNNRLIERHSTRFGPYWRSYDFASNVGARNLFERPLTFVHDGGEHIFALPNGLQGYLLTDARGLRIDRGPTTIVRDARRPDGAVENGLSCMGCHARGLIPKGDQIGAVVRAGVFSSSEQRQVALLHPVEATSLFALDARGFERALAELGVDAAGEEPITRVALAYERELDVAEAASELGVSPGALLRGMERGPEAMAPLKLKATVKRDAFVAAFPVLVERLHVGRARVPGWRGVTAAVRACGLGGSLEERMESCAVAFPQRAVAGFRLVARDENEHEVWLDERRRLLWSEVRAPASQAAAASQCGGLVEALWFLPSAEQLEGALVDGLPGSGWAALWSRDVQNGEKFGPPGISVSAGGRREERRGALLASRCVARL